MSVIESYLPSTRIAYFSMEIALRPEMHTYAGGLGILAGDVAHSAADLELPMVFVTLASRDGYLRQTIDGEGRQIDWPDPWEPEQWTAQVPAMVAVTLEGRDVWIRPWLYELASPLGYKVPVILLDTRLDQNATQDRTVTDRLYGGGECDRLRQEAVLGIGGERMLRALGFSIETYHLNEGHAALLALNLLRRHARAPSDNPLEPRPHNTDPVRRQCIFTTHTPVEAGHDRFAYEDVARVLGDVVALDELKSLAGEDRLNMTRLALNLSGYVNGVARRHAETTRRMFPGYRVRAITNGVHVEHWTHPAFARLFQSILPHWCHEPEVLSRADQLDDGNVWDAHREAKRDLLEIVKGQSGIDFDPEAPVIGFARRMTGYKRPNLLFMDLERVRRLHREFALQIVVAGKAHPRDEGGKALIQQIHGHIDDLRDVPIVFLPNYDMEIARTLTAGSDIWLNTPLPSLEASGTSGMKAALNGVLNLSILDGWWLEACEEGITGWSIDHRPEGTREDHARALYEKLEAVVLPLYAQDRSRWIWMMKQTISKIGPIFNSQHMMRRYASEAYLR
ncbi:alpha-glucan family phosphorylase [Microvirga sp. Mcv34]|uniref:alpha-glucan family phosphorylase n=1 Tax=Microvirga sp. Mcv34 TaxID=2926016 RepID=UPI0021C868DB|nr:alpha-glucan family phosphorylase [Microvirga sp. Mcv34]